MNFYKNVTGDYISSISTGSGEVQIDKNEYVTILDAIQNRPRAVGKSYHLKTNLTWEEYDLPPEPETEELTTEEKAAAFDAIAEIYEEGDDNGT